MEGCWTLLLKSGRGDGVDIVGSSSSTYVSRFDENISTYICLRSCAVSRNLE